MSKTTECWDTYWSANNTHNSFEIDYSQNSGPFAAINTYWRNVFSTIAPNDTIADIGAGNAALLRLAQNTTPNLLFKHWYNVDSANIPAIEILPNASAINASASELGFEDGSISLFTSMFGIEYADLPAALKEVKRCLSAHGKYAFVMHHDDSMISRQSALSLESLQSILDTHLLDDLEKAKTATQAQLGELMLNRFKQHLFAVHEDLQEDIKITAQTVHKILNSHNSTIDCIEKFAVLKTHITWSITRLAQQLAASKKVNDIQHMLNNVGMNDFEVSELMYKQHKLAWVVSNIKIIKE